MPEPDLQMHFLPVKFWKQAEVDPDVDAFTAAVVLVHVHSRGSVRLRSADPTWAPAIDAGYLTDEERAVLVLDLVADGHADKVLLSSNAIGVAKGLPDYDLPFGHVLESFIPLLKGKGLSEEDAQRILVDNPARLLSVR